MTTPVTNYKMEGGELVVETSGAINAAGDQAVCTRTVITRADQIEKFRLDHAFDAAVTAALPSEMAAIDAAADAAEGE